MDDIMTISFLLFVAWCLWYAGVRCERSVRDRIEESPRVRRRRKLNKWTDI